MFAIETWELTKYYSGGKVKALEDFSLQVEKGKIFSLLGPNGAGKTTLIKILLGIVLPTRGRAKLLNIDISRFQARAPIGYLAENHRFPDFLNAHQVLSLYGRMAGVPPSILSKRIPLLLDTVRLREWSREKIKKYSKGMLQRLGIAQALINDPQLMILDEPTDGIDPVGRREIRDLLLALREQGKTIFLNSHLLSEVERVSDEIAILKNGRLLQKGNIQDFISIKDQYQIKLTPRLENPAELAGRLQLSLQEEDGFYLVAVSDDHQLNQLIDELRTNQVNIQAIIPRKISLEDFFIEIVGKK
ncbi:MAG: ABC transporter ATP-binding protein [Calditrichia bacterium]